MQNNSYTNLQGNYWVHFWGECDQFWVATSTLLYFVSRRNKASRDRMTFHLMSFLKGEVNPVYSPCHRLRWSPKIFVFCESWILFIKSALTQPIILQNVGLWRWARYFSSDLNLLSFSVNFFNLTGFHRTHFLAVWRCFLCRCLLWFIKAALTNASNETLSLENVLLFSWSIFVKIRMWNIWDDTLLKGIFWVILLFFWEFSSLTVLDVWIIIIYFFRIIGVKIL